MVKISKVASKLLEQFDLTDNPKIKINALEVIQIQFMVSTDSLDQFMNLVNSQLELPFWLMSDETSSNDLLNGEAVELISEFRHTLSNLMIGIVRKDNELLNQLI